MPAIRKPNYDPQRTRLSTVIPLAAPYTLVIEITRLCNFNCFYCIQSTKAVPGGAYQQNKLKQNFMEMALFEKIAADISKFPVEPKRILLQGLGEPLLYPDLPGLVRRLRNSGYKGRVDLITNGSLMTHQMADELVEAGISKIVISLQGLTKEDYISQCKYPLNYEEFMEQVAYLYHHRKNTHIYIKIIDAMLKTQQDKDKFYRLYENICDSIFIEHLIADQIQMGDINGRVQAQEKNIFQLPVIAREVCPVVFYQMQIFLDGTVLACPISGVPSQELELGNVKKMSLSSIWNGEKRLKLLRKMLSDTRRAITPCNTCSAVHCCCDESIDSDAKEILKRMEK